MRLLPRLRTLLTDLTSMVLLSTLNSQETNPVRAEMLSLLENQTPFSVVTSVSIPLKRVSEHSSPSLEKLLLFVLHWMPKVEDPRVSATLSSLTPLLQLPLLPTKMDRSLMAVVLDLISPTLAEVEVVVAEAAVVVSVEAVVEAVALEVAVVEAVALEVVAAEVTVVVVVASVAVVVAIEEVVAEVVEDAEALMLIRTLTKEALLPSKEPRCRSECPLYEVNLAVKSLINGSLVL